MKKLALAALAVLLLCACASPALAEWQDRYLSQDSAVFDRAFAQEALKLTGLLTWVRGNVPLFSLGLGWILPAALGLAVGLILRKVQK